MASLLTVSQVCERLKLSKSKVYRMTWSGELPTQRIGRSVRVPESAVDQLAEPASGYIPSFLKGGK